MPGIFSAAPLSLSLVLFRPLCRCVRPRPALLARFRVHRHWNVRASFAIDAAMRRKALAQSFGKELKHRAVVIGYERSTWSVSFYGPGVAEIAGGSARDGASPSGVFRFLFEIYCVAGARSRGPDAHRPVLGARLRSPRVAEPATERRSGL